MAVHPEPGSAGGFFLSKGVIVSTVALWRICLEVQPLVRFPRTGCHWRGIRLRAIQDFQCRTSKGIRNLNGWTDTAARRQLAIGINEVTKALERNQLQLLLVCKSVRPQLMTNHLIALSATRDVPACQVPRLSKSVAEHLVLQSVLALGFRRCFSEHKEMFRDVVDAIKPRVPSLEVDWLTDEAAAVPAELTADLEEEEEQMKEGKEEEGGRRAEKRKLEIESEITDSALSCSLRPLKVKRIVPNPDKKRKTKLKKQK
ncbi:ribonuclease P protein subunit p38-like [Gambusia affinis]|uniref:ribonuclease P protein subunit p38-like n=1 Tax=Gambusia affinis TaxID=33528 RepID=UPI001CDD78FE|nr:ribonuclease P protein subunit p38-like [Gambusia affinis]